MITAICPVLNEEKNIKDVINFFLEAKPEEKELLLIDGGSTDNTLTIIKSAIKKNSNIHLCLNKDKYVSFALNMGIKNSNGNPIIRLDAHTSYQNDYFEKILSTFKTTGADIVGGPMNAVGKTPFQKAVAYASSRKFGVGDSKIHQSNFKGETDHVYLGAWKREIFKQVGYFDERLKRNQDDEFHYRAKSLGKKIFLNPEIKSFYYPRSSWRSLFSQYFEYGFFKPVVLRKIKSEIKLRHMVPAFFILYLLSLFFINSAWIYLPTLIYLSLNIYYSFFNSLNLAEKLIAFFIFPTLHIAYGLGFLGGSVKSISS